MRPNTIDDVMDSVEKTEGCWFWTGHRQSGGYGQVGFGGRKVLVYHLLYEASRGPIPDGMLLDHLCHTMDPTCAGGRSCRHRQCVNPGDLQPVTSAENLRRGVQSFGSRTHCKWGHEFTPDNTRLRPTRYGVRVARICLTCERAPRAGVR